ncbi:N-(5'-phosphoribosyl)anthranilate isomerase [BD1-7 clade bacterium]|uniref:N-(5'-phosphoribosyl)anthranilate isomerase n=1 Tax=BD1-7 clade bacterium TaxID=2029982 RepID=A0A5S9PRX7_9GAMM|nr:N-(5'-phosphoribosyl)anthranilate isomerase [BD1-7 clade bacterium]
MPVARVKICGLTDENAARMAASAGADAIGLVFYPPSKRYVTTSQAASIASAIPPFVQRVGLFVNETKEAVERIKDTVQLDLLQFQGGESPEYCESFNFPYIKALQMKPGVDITESFKAFPNARAFLLDTYHPDQHGGIGETFNWDEFPDYSDKPLILAGGLNPDNVQDAIKACQPYAVDVSSGVESGPGIKSTEKMQAFVRSAKSIEVMS